MRRLAILVADGHSHTLTFLQSILEPTYRVVGTVEDGPSLIAAAQALRPYLVLTNVDLPILNGIEATRELHKVAPGCRVVCHSPRNEPGVMAAAFAAGASGFLVRHINREFASSIQAVIKQIQTEERLGMHMRAHSHARTIGALSYRLTSHSL